MRPKKRTNIMKSLIQMIFHRTPKEELAYTPQGYFVVVDGVVQPERTVDSYLNRTYLKN